MNKAQAVIFHLVRAKVVLRKMIAFFGLMSILLTASCGPTPSGSKAIAVPDLSETGNGSGGSVQVLPENLPVQTEAPVQPVAPKVAEPLVKASPIPEIKSQGIPASIPEVKSRSNSNPSSSIEAQASGAGTTEVVATNIDRPSDEDIRGTVERLNANYLWAMMPTYVDSYKDASGQLHEHFIVSPGKSKDLKQLLAKMRDDLVSRDDPDEKLQFEIKEKGTCENSDEKKGASTKSCDSKAPICLSLEKIKATTPKADLELSLRSTIMHEFARQHCADEAMANQVKAYYNLPAIQYFRFTNSVAAIFNRVRLNLVYLQSQLTTGMTPNAGEYAQKIDSKEEICQMITQGVSQAELLSKQVILTGFIQDPANSEKAPRTVLVETLKSMGTPCEGISFDRQSLLQPLETAIKTYDQLAQEFSKKSRMIVMDFSKHLWPHGNVDGTGK